MRVRRSRPAGSRAAASRLMTIYIVELDQQAPLRRRRGSHLPLLYVGVTLNSPERRFEMHKKGGRTASVIVTRFGRCLRPDLYERYPRIPIGEAAAFEQRVAQELRCQGYTVDAGGVGFGWDHLVRSATRSKAPGRKSKRGNRRTSPNGRAGSTAAAAAGGK